MLKLCRTKNDTFTSPPPPPIGPYLLINIPRQLEVWYKEVARPSIILKLTGYKSKVSSSYNIPTFINFLHSRASSWQNLHACTSYSFRKSGIILRNISIIPALCLMLQIYIDIVYISIYTLSDLGVLSNLIGSLSLANEHYSPSTE